MHPEACQAETNALVKLEAAVLIAAALLMSSVPSIAKALLELSFNTAWGCTATIDLQH